MVHELWDTLEMKRESKGEAELIVARSEIACLKAQLKEVKAKVDELEREVKKWNRQYKTREGILMKQREVFRSTCNQIQAKLDAVKPLPKRLDRFRLKDSIGPLYEAGYHDGCADAAQLIRKAIAEPE